jgi:hypothetical protein
MSDEKAAGKGVEDFGAAVEDCIRTATNSVLDQQKAIWTSFRETISTQLGGDSTNKATQETAKLMMSSFLQFAGMERDMRKRFVDLHVSFADRQIEILESHRQSAAGGGATATKKSGGQAKKPNKKTRP